MAAEEPNTEHQPESEKVFRQIGDFVSRWSTSHRIRFGGVVGKIAYIAVACVAGASVVVLRDHEVLSLALVALFFGFGGVVIFGILKYAAKHPMIATMEGAEVLQWHQQMMAGAKGVPYPPPASDLIAAPLRPPLVDQKAAE